MFFNSLFFFILSRCFCSLLPFSYIRLSCTIVVFFYMFVVTFLFFFSCPGPKVLLNSSILSALSFIVLKKDQKNGFMLFTLSCYSVNLQ